MIPKRPPRPYSAEYWAARGVNILDRLTRGRYYDTPKSEAPVRRLTDKPRPEIFDER